MRLTRITALIALVVLLTMTSTAQTGTLVLNNNTSGGSTVWFISGERTLVLNGFDLGPLDLTLPVQVGSVSIQVEVPQPGAPVDVVVYQDANGGSPADATLLSETRIDITQAGNFTYTFPVPVEVTAPVVWVGFYLPVDFEFLADNSGSSVLTYWGWSPGTTFNLSNLNTASVFGPSNGTAPVNLDLGGIARITTSLLTDGVGTETTSTIDTTTTTTSTNTTSGDRPNLAAEPVEEPPIRQQVGSVTDLSPMLAYPDCTVVSYDRADVAVNYRDGIRWFCKFGAEQFAPETPEGYVRRGMLYDVYVFGLNSSSTNRFEFPVTHCITPATANLNTAVIGLAYGAPREWEILPTVRYGAVVCAELFYSGYISYFTPG